MTHYEDGARFERAVRTDLQADGYWVMRAAGSKTKADLIAIKPGQVLIIQCKRNGKIGPAERQALRAISGMINFGGIYLSEREDLAIPILAWKRDGVARPQYARITGFGSRDRVTFVTDRVIA